jgi:hypothetical protein
VQTTVGATAVEEPATLEEDMVLEAEDMVEAVAEEGMALARGGPEVRDLDPQESYCRNTARSLFDTRRIHNTLPFVLELHLFVRACV